MMDETDKKLLNLAQQGLPISEEPFHKMGLRLGISAEEVLDRLKALKDRGYIRRIGGVFDSKKLGYDSTVVAVKAPEEDTFARIAAHVSSHPGVTHCYRRDDEELNLWFTLTCKDDNEKRTLLLNIERMDSAVEVFDLPAEPALEVQRFVPAFGCTR